jgi:NADH-quinone oxidoreductase subunit A
MNKLLLIPPIAFLFVLILMMLELAGLKIFSRDVRASASTAGREKAYACGEDVKEHRVQPDYRQFFPFAFFFTIMHVVGMIVATVPAGSFAPVAIAAFYLVAASIGLFIIFRR